MQTRVIQFQKLIHCNTQNVYTAICSKQLVACLRTSLLFLTSNIWEGLWEAKVSVMGTTAARTDIRIPYIILATTDMLSLRDGVGIIKNCCIYQQFTGLRYVSLEVQKTHITSYVDVLVISSRTIMMLYLFLLFFNKKKKIHVHS